MKTGIEAYVCQVKHLFPFLGKPERDYLEKLRWSLEDCFENQPSPSLEEVTQKAGRPEGIVSQYFHAMEPEELVKSLRRSRLWRIIQIGFLVILVAAAVLCVFQMWIHYQGYLYFILDLKGQFTEIFE